MANIITVDKEKNTISGILQVERGGGHIGGKLTATIELQDMTPLDLSNINELTSSLAKDIIYSIYLYALNR